MKKPYIYLLLLFILLLISGCGGVDRDNLQLTRIVSESMEPTIQVNQFYLVDKYFNYNDLKVGDIISFEHNGDKITHRIYVNTDNGFITKGDNNIQPDMWFVTIDNYIGKVVKIYD